MGDLMRHYWIPALTSDELPAPDCPPIRLRLLGENLIAFRATSGAVGFIANSCPHRGASLFFGRNEEEGLRCVYHGWKFDVDGNCVDMPSEPAESNFKSKVKATTYPCRERNGIIWTYMGTKETPPALPDIEPNMMAECQVQKIVRDCNYMQALEGDIDTVHAPFLHRGATAARDVEDQKTMGYYELATRAPIGYSVVDTEFGTSYGAWRPAEPDTYYWRIANFLFPFYTEIPTGVLGVQILVRAWVPMDDDSMMFWNISAPSSRQSPQNQTTRGTRRGANIRTTSDDPNVIRLNGQEYTPDTSDWTGKWRLAANAGNDYKIDRELQASNASFTGINLGGAFLQDQAVTESMGTIYMRDNEHLGTSDSMIIRTRRRLVNAARDLREKGITPPGSENPEFYRYRSGGVILPRSVDWFEATRELRKAFIEHAPEEVYAPALATLPTP
jgi:phenylpropionate dioxygenase-like ring-hydroxylating dioxygenase large terminal subunit